MRLSLVLSSFHRRYLGPIPKHPGNVLRGRKRFVPPVTLGLKIGMLQELKQEEINMKYLSRPYINDVQEKTLLASLGRTHPEYWDDFLRQPIEEPLKQHYAADYLEKLDTSRSFAEED